MSTTSDQFAIDNCAFRRNRQRSASRFGEAGFLLQESGTRMFDRLPVVRLPDGPILDLGCATGAWTRRLEAQYPGRSIVALDPAPALAAIARDGARERRGWWDSLRRASLRHVSADLGRLPFRAGSFAMVWSNLVLHWLAEPEAAWREIGSVLRPGGLLMFSLLGPDTLRELRGAWRLSGRPSPTLPFADMHNVGDALVRAGFAAPVMDMDKITVAYRRISDLVDDLRNQGATNVLAGRPRGLLGRGAWGRIADVLEPRGPDEKLNMTVEVVYGHAWWPDSGPVRTRDGLDIVRIHGLGARRAI
ncbi:MAG: methyltransferase domain-containing protein [Betaproteobacteria bacterium]|jgi:malonyl-CoA O-methyltransferase